MAQKKDKKSLGIQWPSGGSADVSKATFAASVAGVDDEAAASVSKEKNWRNAYMPHFVRHVEACLTSPEAALKVSQQGLAFVYENFHFARQDGQTVSIHEAMSSPKLPCPFEAAVVQGTKTLAKKGEVTVPWSLTMQPGNALSGVALEDQLEKATAQGLIEPTVVDAIRRLNHDQSWSEKLADTCFVVLGAGSAMGPLTDLLSLGATVVAVDIAVPALWKLLFKVARESAGTLVFPVRAGSPKASDDDLAAAAGCNIIEEAPEILNWLQTVHPERHFVIGTYAYADGVDFPRVAIAMDAISTGMAGSHDKGKVSFAYLCSPTDVFGIPVEARAESSRRYSLQGMGAGAALWQVPLRTAGVGKILTPNNCGRVAPRTNGRPVVDCQVVQQGPNYLFAKRLQHWRAIVALSEGTIVSANIAPASHTVSVRKNKLLAAAYDGCRRFGVEIFNPQTSAALMTALLLDDIYFHDSQPSLAHPLELFMHGAAHGGMWRQPYSIRSIVEVAAVIQLLFEYKVPHVLGAAAGVVALRRARL